MAFDSARLFAFLLAYLLGAIPFGLILTKLTGGGDIRAIGSGNIGATNVLRSGRKGLAAVTLLLDLLKGTAAILAVRHFFPGNEASAAAGAILGHLYPLWLGFKGGKGVATFMGVLTALLPVAALVYALVWLGMILATRYSSVGGMTAAFSAPITAFFAGRNDLVPILIALALLIIWMHRDNIARLRSGRESKVGATAA